MMVTAICPSSHATRDNHSGQQPKRQAHLIIKSKPSNFKDKLLAACNGDLSKRLIDVSNGIR
ncbi:hypothetical protein H1S01_03080 [Heliobacterium chlorum]|uniref:Uncharacterized protein n=1 Tax=Heliobacterium chlorum TaxID=2698 RepID=A0ABR7SY86_HELCL|nr:hypothetical protein [Heliobacterium chlorum]MBC9783494.1 hypothetical protein [Heliobacterium chlorum]